MIITTFLLINSVSSIGMITFQGISKIYNHKTQALKDVSFQVGEGEFASIVGRSGAGKSTLVKLLIAEERPTSGKIIVDGEDVSEITPKELPGYRREIGIVFQDFKLLQDKTAYENIAFAMEVAGLPPSKIKNDVPRILKIVGLKDRADNFPAQLSGGEKQRVATGRAIALKPTILVADEPTGNLDPIHTWEIIDLLVKINQLDTTVLLASHDKEIINSLSKRVVSLEKGKVIRDEEEGRFIL